MSKIQLQTKLKMALMLAMKGFYVFPLVEDGKVPEAIFDWRARSTRDTEIIKSWFEPTRLGFERNPNIGIDCAKSGILVVDVDTKDGKRGDQAFDDLGLDYGWPETLQARTVSGASHYFFRNTFKLRNTASKLAEGIDTRGIGGYVVAPGSYVVDEKRGYEGEYVWLNELEIAPMPEWLGEKLAAYKFKTDSHDGKETISEDDPSDIARSIEWLKEHAEHAVEGAGGDHTTYAVAAQLKEFGCSRGKTLELMLDHWNEECSPPWDAEDLERKVGNAYRYAQKATGLASANAEFDINEEPPAGAVKKPRVARPLEKFDVDAIPMRDWVFGPLALARNISVAVAPPGAGKTTFTLTMALSKATGRDLLGINPGEAANVWIYNNEDDLQEMQRRVGAIMQQFGVPWEALYDADVNGADQKPRLFINSGEEQPLRIAKKIAPNGAIKPEDAQWAIDEIRRNQIKLWIVDPFISTHPGSENDNNDIEAVADIYRRIAQKTDCAIILVHHTKKLDIASSEGHNGNLDTVRGASALGGVARIAFTLFGMSAKHAKQYEIPEDQRRRYIGLCMAKANMSAINDEMQWFEKLGVCIGATAENMDGEEIGVLRRVKLHCVPKMPKERSESKAAKWEELLLSIIQKHHSPELGYASAETVKSAFKAATIEEKLAPNSHRSTLSRAQKFLINQGTITLKSGNYYILDRNTETTRNSAQYAEPVAIIETKQA